MIILIADHPELNTNVESLTEAYKKAGAYVICGSRNFFYSNFIPDILHIQWPEKIYNWYPFSALEEEKKLRIIEDRLKYYKENKVIIVHTIHNIEPHLPEKINFEKKVFKLVIEYSDILLHYCSKSINILNQNYSESIDKRNIVNPRGDYLLDFQDIPKDEARRKLGIPEDKFVILNFGSQQKYKGEEFIESVFKKLPIKHKFLLTAGSYRYFGYSKPVRVLRMVRNYYRTKQSHRNRLYHYKPVDPKDLPAFISSCDLFFLAHQGSLNSGILPLAATFAKPVVFPDIGCFKEQMNNWVYESYDKNNIQSAVKAIISMFNRIQNIKNNFFDNSLWLGNNSWENHVYRILNAYSEIRNELITDTRVR